MHPFVAAIAEQLRRRAPKRGPAVAAPPDAWTVLAAWGPCGFSPVAPGTVGTAGAIPLAWAVAGLPRLALLPLLAAFFLLSVAAATRAARHWRVVDASPIVIDEVIGYLVAMAFVPFSWPAALAGFLLFRLFDVWKPWPASYFDSVKSGFGVVMDDVAAGLYAGAGLWLLHRYLPAVIP